MHVFTTTDAVELALQEIAAVVERPLWVKLPRSPGKKEERYQHLLSGEPSPQAETECSEPGQSTRPSPLSTRDARIQDLEANVTRLQNELDELKTAFDEFRRQFV